jgi:hypothetical protein
LADTVRSPSAVLLSQHGIDHLHAEARLGFGQALEALDAIHFPGQVPAWREWRPFPDEGLDADGEHMGDRRQ